MLDELLVGLHRHLLPELHFHGIHVLRNRLYRWMHRRLCRQLLDHLCGRLRG